MTEIFSSIGVIPFLIVCPLVFLAGLIDSIAGGGGLISLPSYMLAGLPTINAIATNKLGSSIGTVASTVRYVKNGYYDKGLAIPTVVAALTGAYFGAKLLLTVNSDIIKYPMIISLPIVAFIIFREKDLGSSVAGEISRKKQAVLVTLFSLILGAYCGFYGPGTGTFLLILYTKFAKMDIKAASGNVKLVNLSSNILSTYVFLTSGNALIPLGIVAGVFCIAGHYIGSGLVMKNGFKAVKPIIIVVLTLLMIKLITGY